MCSFTILMGSPKAFSPHRQQKTCLGSVMLKNIAVSPHPHGDDQRLYFGEVILLVVNNTFALLQLPYSSVYVRDTVMKTGLLFLKGSCFPDILFQPENSNLCHSTYFAVERL